MIPMFVGSRFRRPVRTAAKRSKVWFGFVGSTIDLPPSNVSFETVITEANLETQGKPTIARVRGSWVAHQDVGAAGSTSGMWVTAGLTIVSTKAVAAGISSLPTPSTNVEWPWLWWDTVYCGIELVTGVGFQMLSPFNRVVDSKAMRKVPPASTVVMVYEAVAAGEGAPDCSVSASLRLLLLPS